MIAGGNGANLASFQSLNIDKLFEMKTQGHYEPVANNCEYNCATPAKLENCPSTIVSREHQNESFVTLTSNNEAGFPSRKESNNDLRRYIKMVC